MIRTAILAGILLVMLSIAYSRPGALPAFGTRASTVAEEPEVLRDESAAAPAVHHQEPPRPAPAPVAKEEEPKREEPTLEESEVAASIPKQPATPAAPAAAEPGRPVPLLPQPMALPLREAARISSLVPDDALASPATAAPQPQESAAPAPLPDVYVPTRPVNAPQDLASRLTPDGKIAPMPAAEPRAPVVAAAGAKFMTPQERSRELYRLAREMEDTFIEKMTQ